MIEFQKATINIEKCTKCKLCIETCVRNIYSFESDILKPSDNFDEECIECGHCVAVCPARVFNLKYHTAEDIEPVPSKEKLPSFDLISNLIQKRRSIRNFKDKSVPKDLLERIINLAKYSPTASNQENVHYTIVQDPNTLKKFSEETTLNVKNFVEKFEDPEGRASLESVLSAELIEKAAESVVSFKKKLKRIEKGEDIWRRNAEIIILHSAKNSTMPTENCSLAAMNIMLAAETLGLATCSLGYAMILLNQFRTVAKIVKIPRKHKVCYVLAVGYPKVKYSHIPSRKPVKVKWL
jgi:nitroreductase/NAD-dependent dihydropyrimidine dehydrogenase PreA subunit